jgi:hypothetical protein
MGTLWTLTENGWQCRTLPDEGLAELGAAGFCRFGRGPDGGVALLVPGGIDARVNGEAILGGLRVLGHKDEILLGTARFAFSTEATPKLEIFHNEPAMRSPSCPVCRGPIQDGQTAVRCPGCGRCYHQITAADSEPARPCWTYAPTCRFCEHPTALTGAALWQPESEHEHA